MKIGVDATCWLNNRGYGRHLRALMRALAAHQGEHRYTLIMDSEPPVGGLPVGCDVRVVSAGTPAAVAASAAGRRSLRDMYGMSRALSSPEFDLTLFPTIYSYVPTFGRAKRLVVIHDVIAETYPQLTIPSRAGRLFWNAKVALGRLQAHAIVTVSEYSKRLIVERFRMRPDQVFVVGEASDGPFQVLKNAEFTPTLRELGIRSGNRHVIYVGGFSPHKNLETLVAAFARVTSEKTMMDVKLVMVGDYQKEVFFSYFATVKKLVEQHQLESRVIFTGYLPDAELVVLLNLGTVLVLPSLMEGFGLPAVEAAACGCPVIATTASPLPELLGEGGIFVEPTQRNLEESLQEVLSCPAKREHMRAAGIAAAGALTWNSAALQMLDVFTEVSQWRNGR